MSNARTLANTINASSQIVVPSGGIAFTDLNSSNDAATANEAYVMGQDGYETGTWTPIAGSNITTLSDGEGSYTKVGNLVTVTFYATITPTSTSSSMGIDGLPFEVADYLSLTGVGATGILFEDTSIYLMWSLQTTPSISVELDRPVEGSASTTTRNYRGLLTYFSTS